MADNNQIDELKLGISIGGLDNSQIKNLQYLSNTLKDLDKRLTPDFMHKLEVLSNIKINVDTNQLNNLNKNLEKTADKANKAKEALDTGKTSINLPKGDDALKNAEKAKADYINFYKKAFATTLKVLMGSKAVDGLFTSSLKNNPQIQERIDELDKEIEKRKAELEVEQKKAISAKKESTSTIDDADDVPDFETELEYLEYKQEFIDKQLGKEKQSERTLLNLYGQKFATEKKVGKIKEDELKDEERISKLASIKAKFSPETTRQDLLQEKLRVVREKMQSPTITEEQLVRLKEQELSIEEKIKKLQEKEAKDSDKSTKSEKKKLGTFGKLGKTLGRIAIYRMIRATLKQITQTTRQGAQALAQFSPEFNQTMSQLTSAGKNLRMSFISAVQPLITAVTPFITTLANTLTNINNSLGESISYMMGLGTYTKVNTEYQENYNKAVSKLSFDKFDVLQDSSYGGFEEVVVDTEKMAENASIFEGIKSMVESFKTMLSSVGGCLGTLWEIIKGIATDYGADIISVLNSVVGFIQDIIDQITVVFTGIKNVLNLNITKSLLYTGLGGLKLIFEAIRGVIQTITTLMDALLNWNWEGLGDKIKNVWKSLDWESGLQTSAKGTSFLKQAFLKLINPKLYATGGVPETGSLFYAGEAGAEIVANTGHGTGVMNMEQLRSAIATGMKEALYSMRQPNSNETIEIKISDETLFTAINNSAKRRGLTFAKV